MSKKIIKTLNPPPQDYWAPTKNTLKIFVQKYIKPNIYFIIIIIIIILFLLYRYRTIKNKREQQNNNYQDDQDKRKYMDILLNIYNQNKENLREPLRHSKLSKS